MSTETFIHGGAGRDNAIRIDSTDNELNVQQLVNGAYSGDDGVGTPTTDWTFVHGRAGEINAIRFRLNAGSPEWQQWVEGGYFGGDGGIGTDTTEWTFIHGRAGQEGAIRFRLDAGEPDFEQWTDGAFVELSGLLITEFDFTSSLPSGFSYSRSGDARGYVDDTGGSQVAAANEVEIDHDFDGNPLGLRFSPAATNKNTNTNWGMTDTSGLTKGGNVTATLTVSTHPVYGFPVYRLNNNVGGSGTAYVNIAGATGNTNAHSASIFCRALAGLSGTGGCWINNNFGQNTTIGTKGTDEDERIVLENVAWGSTNVMRFNVGINHDVIFWFNQLEENEFATPPVVVDGSTGTANSHTLVCTDLAQYIPSFNDSRGMAVAEVAFAQPSDIISSDQYVFLFSEGTDLDNTLAMRLEAATNAQVRPNVRVGTSTKTNNDVGQKPIANKRFPVALSWESDNTNSIAGVFRDRDDALTGTPENIDRLYLGGRPFNEKMFGWLKKLTVYSEPRTRTQVKDVMFPSENSYKGVLCAGQSLMQYRFRATGASGTPTYGNEGETEFINIVDGFYTSSENWCINAASDGSNLVGSSGTNYWLEESDLSDGPLLIEAKAKIDLFGAANIVAIDWDQGESNSNASKSDFKTWTMGVLDELRTYIVAQGGTAPPCFITLIGRRSDGENTDYNTVREAQREMISENTYVHKQPEKVIWDLQDDVHLTGEGFGEVGKRAARKVMDVLGETVSGGVDGPAITNVSRSGTTVTVTITHDGGSDFTPTSAIEGFKFLDDGSPITITDAVRTNATTVTLTLDSEPTGVEDFYYIYASVYEGGATDPDNLVRDNDTVPMPLQSYYERL